MAKGSNQKLKLLYLMKILMENTDENNPMTVNDMISGLHGYGIQAERKSIYDDLEALKIYGIDIASRKSKTTGYFVAERTFELPELKLLVDSVQCSKFITHKKSHELIKKIESLASRYEAMSLQRQVYVANRVKAINESIYYNVDRLHTAIAENKQVTFKYFDYNLRKEKVYRKKGGLYTVSPYALSWDDENYYLITYSSKYKDFTHYRVDRMSHIELTDVLREPLEDMEDFNVAEYSKKVFSMFGGEEVKVKLKMDNSLINSVIDRFGKDIMLQKMDESSFYTWVNVAVSSAFFAWISQFGSKAKIISPENVVEDYKGFIIEIIQQYE
ncbi:helix-turn-helix transcriptional regulator [Clostridium polynesiense]|uniref:helix-turn-helix transcriptional regulator n=1 Tax=Clostridium polynesiense TaxID=1325933 RepID=UPI000590EE2F|nr:WYL domain-containing protein [Clostridium polynesiense]